MLRRWLYPAILVLLVALMACAPKQAPSAPGPAPQPPASASVPSSAPASAPEDPAWARVVDAAKKEGRLVVYTYTFSGDTGNTFARAFKDKYGITIDFISGRSPSIVERLRTEYRANQIVADLAEGAGARMALLKDGGFTASMRELPVLKEKDVWKGDVSLYDPEASSLLIYTATPITMIANTQLVKPGEEPASWQDLLDPKWKGKVVTMDPAQGTEPYYLYVGMTNKKALPPDFFDSFARQEIHFSMGGPSDTARALARGEGYIGAPASALGAIPVIQEGGPIKLLSPKEGFPVTTLPFVFMKNGPHPNAGKLFVNWLLSAEGMSLYAKTTLTYSFRKDVPDAAPPNARVDWSKGLVLTLKDELDVANSWAEQRVVKILKK